MKLVECVPNFSEGRDEQAIASLARAGGDAVLHVDPNPDAHRTVLTLAGEPNAVVEAAFQAASRAVEVIDMTRHQGAHPRLGAIDVCPLVPLAGVTLDECTQLARILGQRIGEELGLPVYLYGAAAVAPDRRRLAWIRRGGYEGLSARLEDPNFKPDFGPAKFNPRSGAAVVGARNILIAFNVNLDTDDLSLADEIARSIRTAGSPARLPDCQALGWLMPEYGRAQVSLNLTDYRVTPLHVAYETVKREARRRGREVTGSELVGMAPMEALLAAGRHYLAADRTAGEVGLEELLASAIDGLGLASVRPFEPSSQVLELRLAQTTGAAAAWARETMDRLSNSGGRDEMKL